MKAVSSKEFRNLVVNKQVLDGLAVEKEVSSFAVMPDDLMSFVFSSKVVDLAGDVVHVAGIDYKNYLERNPLVLTNHDMTTFPIGKTVSMSVQGDDLIGTIQFFTDLEVSGIGEKARAVTELVKRKVMGISITFLPKEFALNQTDGLNFYKSYLVEASVCSVPCCPTAFAIDAHKELDGEIIEALEEQVEKWHRQRESSKRRRNLLRTY